MKIAIIGLGVMGGSYAAKLTQLGYTVHGVDPDQKTLDYALEHGLVNSVSTKADEQLYDCTMIVFCIYPSLLKGWLQENQHLLRPGSVIFEISGVKRAVMDDAHDVLRKDLELVSIHPMCGRESKGIENSTPDIFAGSNFIIVPHPDNSECALLLAHQLALSMGFGRINRLDADQHDDMIAFLSQLTHVIAVSLMNTHENAHLVEFTGDSFRDLTRIARINEDMWSELFLLNKDLLLDEISQFQDSLSGFKEALEMDNVAKMKELFVQSTKRREKFA